SERRREVAVRVALGASRARLASQFLVESVLLAIGGGALGLIVGWAGVGVLRGALPANMPRVNEIRVDLAVLAACALVSVFVGIAFVLAPALFAARTDPQHALRERSGEASGRAGARLRDALVMAEVALAFVLVVGAGLMIRTLWNLEHVDP